MSGNDVEKKRQYVMDLYSGPRWKARVEKMSEAQVLAIYLREQNRPNASNEERGNDPAPF